MTDALDLWTWDTGFGFIPAQIKGKDPADRIHDHRIYKPHGTVAWYRKSATFPQLGSCIIEETTLKKKEFMRCEWRKKPGWGNPPLILVPSFFKDYEDKIIWDVVAKVCYELQHARHVILSAHLSDNFL